MSFPRYDKYQESGVEWLGEIPGHWESKRLKYAATLLTDKSHERNNAVALENIEGWSGRFIPSETEFAGEGVEFRTGDILFGKLRPYLAKVWLAEFPGEAVGDFHVMRPSHNNCGRYMTYLMLTRDFISIVDGSTFGAKMPRASWDFMCNMILPVPPIEEQAAIANFLDAETSKIDALVAEQRRLIELLKEKRQAVISHAVTKGLNPNAPLKDSGIEWLGEVPEHWAVLPLKRLGNICYGIGEPPKYQEDGTPLVRATNVRSGTISPIGLVFVNPEDIPEQRIVWLEVGDIIVVRSGAGTGDSAIIPNDYGPAIAGFDMVLRVRKATPWYIQYVLLSSYVKEGQIDLEKMRAAQPHLNAEELGNCEIVLPPDREQNSIVEYLSIQTKQFDLLMKEAEQAIELLQERRTALISAAVTGKIDVREYTAQETA